MTLIRAKTLSCPALEHCPQSRAPHESTKLTRQEMLDRSGALATVLDGAISAGLIEAKKIFSSDDLAVLNSVVEASRFGLEPRHLRGMRLAVDREVGAGLASRLGHCVVTKSPSPRGIAGEGSRAVRHFDDTSPGYYQGRPQPTRVIEHLVQGDTPQAVLVDISGW